MKRYVFLIASAIAILFSVALAGHGWRGIPNSLSLVVALSSGIIGVTMGASVFRCFWLALRPRIYNRLRLRALSALVASILAFFATNLAGGLLVRLAPANIDEELYIWGVFFVGGLSGIIALFFGAGLGQPDWRDEPM